MAHMPASDASIKDYGSLNSMVKPVIVKSFVNQTYMDSKYSIHAASKAGNNGSVFDFRSCDSNVNDSNREDPPLKRIDDEFAKLKDGNLVGETDALLAKELNQLSMKEREEVYHDIHGVAEIVGEAPEFVEIKLKEIEEELANIPVKDAYNQAKEKSPEYVTSIRKCLMFLRADRFDAREAAARMVRYYQEKLHIFGHEPLARDILMSDLNEEERSSLKAGYIQLLPGRDGAGRAIIFGLNKLRTGAFRGSAAILFWYLTMAAFEDEETQKKGVVLIPYNIGATHAFDRRNSYIHARLTGILPIRVAGLHGCTQDPRQHTLMSLALNFIGTNMRVRTRIHFGTDLECQYELMTYGISTKLLPVDADGMVSLENHREWIRSRIEQEESSEETLPRIIVPGLNDVLLGRGKLIQEHTGNRRFREIVENHREEYENTRALEKTLLASRIVESLKRSGGRFMKQYDACWREVDDDTARDKVGHSFRNKRRAENEKKGKDASNPAFKAANAARKSDDMDVDSKRARETTRESRSKAFSANHFTAGDLSALRTVQDHTNPLPT